MTLGLSFTLRFMRSVNTWKYYMHGYCFSWKHEKWQDIKGIQNLNWRTHKTQLHSLETKSALYLISSYIKQFVSSEYEKNGSCSSGCDLCLEKTMLRENKREKTLKVLKDSGTYILANIYRRLSNKHRKLFVHVD